MHNWFAERQPVLARLRSEWRSAFRSLSNRNFRVYSIGQLVSVSGTWMQSVALSWLVYKLTGSATALGFVSFASLLPVLLLSYFAGGVADRYDRKRIIVVTQWLGAIQAAALAVLTATGLLTVPLVVALSLLLGVAVAFQVPARQVFVADLVEEGELVNAIGLNSAIFNVSRMLGPVLAGVLIGWFGESVCFAINAATYVVALITLGMIVPRTRSSDKPADTADAVRESVWAVIKRTGVTDLLMLTTAISIFGFQFAVLLPVLVDTVLHGDATALGVINAAVGVGALAGSLALASRGKSKTIWRILGFATLGLSGALVVIGWSDAMLLSLGAAALAGFCLSTHFVGGNSLVQFVVPEKVKGRVLGIYSLALLGLAPFGSLLAGWLGDVLGVSATLYLAALVCAVFGSVYLWRTGGRSKTDA